MRTLTVFLMMLPATAYAGNQTSVFLGNMAALSGGAVTAVGDDGASLWYNPAGLVVSRRDRLDLSGSAYTLRLRDYPGILRGDMPELSDDDDPLLDLSSTEVLSVPSALAYARHVSDELSVGFGVFVPLLDRFSATSEMKVRDASTTLDASVEIGSETTVYAAAIGLGWRAHPRLRLGATLALYYQSVDLAQTLLFGYDAPADGDPRRGNGAIVQEEEVERFGFNLSFGAQWHFDDAWVLGLVVRTPLVQLYESLERRRFQLGADVGIDGIPTITTNIQPLRRAGFGASVFLNFGVTLALAWHPKDDRFVSLECDLQPGSEDDGIARDLVWNVRLGGVIPIDDTLRVGAGMFTDRSWEPDPETAWVDQVDFFGVAGGVYLETPIRLADSAEPLVFTSSFALRYAIGFGTTRRAVADPSGVSTDPTGAQIDLTFHEIGLHIGSGLKF